MTTLTTPQTVILRTDVYSLDCSNDTGANPPYSSEPAFLWMGMRGAYWLTSYNPFYQVAQYYTRWTYSCVVNTVRTLSVGANGLVVSDAQVATLITMTLSQLAPAPASTGAPYPASLGAWYYLTSNPAGGVTDSYGAGAGSYYTPLPPTLSFTYDNATFNAATGLTTGIPIGKPVFLSDGTITVNAQSPAVSVDPVNTFSALIGGSMVTVNKLIGNALLPTINEGGRIDPQTDAGAISVEANGGTIVESTTGPFSGPHFFGGVSGTTFGLIMDRPNVPLGSLACKSVSQGSFPVLPLLSVLPNATGALFSSAACNVADWGGFRYLKFTARVNGFSASQPLPRILIGVVPTTQLSAALCESAQLNAPTAGIWYEAEVTAQGTAGQDITIDMGRPIQGSGTWFDVDGQSYALPDPLGSGVYSVNPCVPLPGAPVPSYFPDAGVDLQGATLVICVDSAACSLV